MAGRTSFIEHLRRPPRARAGSARRLATACSARAAARPSVPSLALSEIVRQLLAPPSTAEQLTLIRFGACRRTDHLPSKASSRSQALMGIWSAADSKPHRHVH